MVSNSPEPRTRALEDLQEVEGRTIWNKEEGEERLEAESAVYVRTLLGVSESYRDHPFPHHPSGEE